MTLGGSQVSGALHHGDSKTQRITKNHKESQRITKNHKDFLCDSLCLRAFVVITRSDSRLAARQACLPPGRFVTHSFPFY